MPTTVSAMPSSTSRRSSRVKRGRRAQERRSWTTRVASSIPTIQAIPAGKLNVLNSDPVLHNTHGYYGKRTAFNVALPNQGQTVEVELPRAGQVKIECDAHGWMLGFVYVVANPYYALTAEDGTFEITDVPPGNYTLVANQAYTGPIEVDVTVKAGETAEIPVELAAP